VCSAKHPDFNKEIEEFVNSEDEGAAFAVDCADNAPLGVANTDQDAPLHAGDYSLIAALNPNCKQWDVASVPPSFTEITDFLANPEALPDVSCAAKHPFAFAG